MVNGDRQGEATWTWDAEHGCWYVALAERRNAPYLQRVSVSAIIDLDAEGRVAGIEIVDTKMPGPPELANADAPRS